MILLPKKKYPKTWRKSYGTINRGGFTQDKFYGLFFENSPYLRSFYERIKTKKGAGQAIIATSRKMLGVIYNTLKNNWVFEDSTQFKLAPQGAA